MKRNLIFSIGLVSIISGGAVIARETPESCSYDEKTGYFFDNGAWHSNGSWEHAKKCALEGRLPASVQKRLGAWGDADTRIASQKLLSENHRVSSLSETTNAPKTSKNDDKKQEKETLAKFTGTRDSSSGYGLK